VRNELAERPLERADQDRLGVATHAQKLAALIGRAPLPLTVGIYGPWGAGKTSFANIVVEQLTSTPGWDDLDVISFSAWPYVAPEAIWQALVEKIARRVYGQENDAKPASTDAGWKAQLRSALRADALRLRPVSADPGKESYDKLIQRLSASAGVANRSASGQFGDLTPGAFARLVLAAAGTFSGPIGQLSALFPGGSPATGSPQETVLTSIEQIRDDLAAIFAHAGQKRTVIVIDDLDRCLPEVALDVLETIKIFFFESDTAASRWLFLVPADERLVGRGLRARLGIEQDDFSDIGARAYLEKIIQLGISLPEIKTNDAHGLVADHCPEWAGASDLIVSAFEGNPRRVKQQGALLSYKYADRPSGNRLVTADNVSDSAVAPKEREAVLLTERGVTIFADLVHMDCTAPRFLAALRDLQGDQLQLDGNPALDEILSRNPELRDGFSKALDLAASEPGSLSALACLADLYPGRNGIPRTWDPAFPYVAQTIVDQDGTTTPRSLAVRYLQRLLEIKDKLPKLIEEAGALSASSGRRYGLLAAMLDSWVDAQLRGEDLRASPVIMPLAMVLEPLFTSSLDDIRKILTDEPRLSAIPGPYVRLAAASTVPIPGAVEVAGLPVHAYLEAAFQMADENVHVVLDAASVLRLAVARDLMERRRYAKVQLLFTRWPELLSLARGHGGARRLRDLESAILRGDPDVDLPKPWKHLRSDEHLREFLQLPPSLAQVYEGEVSSIADMPGASSAAAEAQTPAGESVNEAYRNLYLHASADAADSHADDVPASDAHDAEAPRPTLEVAAASGPAVIPAPSPVTGEITLTFSAEGEGGTKGRVSVPVDAIVSEQLSHSLLIAQTQTGNVRDVRSSLTVREILTDVGTLLWSSTIGQDPALERAFIQAFESHDRLRLAVASAHDPLAALPWECLFIPQLRLFAGQAIKLSVIRRISDPARLGIPRPARPLRVLVACSSPRELGVLGVDQEIRLIERSLESAIGDGSARMQVVRDATLISTMDEIRAFRPHIFHFVGHAGYSGDQGVIIFTGEDGRPDLVPAAEMGLLLQERGIMLAVLNGCETGWPNLTDMTRGVSQTLVRQGVPAVIGTVRTVTDDSALLFAAEFYRALADGFVAEPALVEARKALALRGRDWSAYIMYANTQFPLHSIGIKRAASLI
jgi:hypothetical protein